MNIIFKKESYIYFLIFALLVGIFTFRDYGIGIEEHFRENLGYIGFYLLNFLI